MDDFTKPELAFISKIIKAKNNLPDEFWAVGIVQEIALLLARNEPILSDDDCRFLIGVGAYIAAIGDRELSAQIQAALALKKAAAHD